MNPRENGPALRSADGTAGRLTFAPAQTVAALRAERNKLALARHEMPPAGRAAADRAIAGLTEAIDALWEVTA